MDLVETIKQRKSIRAFKSEPVSPDLLKRVLEQALRAPSWANTQPWEFAIAGGKVLDEIIKLSVAKGEEKPYPDIARPPEFPEPYISRIKALAPPGRVPTKEDMDNRLIRSRSHYGAPAVIYILIDRSFFYQPKGLNVWSLYDCGAVSQNIGLLATNYGLGTVEQAQAVIYPDILRQVLGTPESKLFAIGIAIGYPDWKDPITQSQTVREPLNKIATWHGF